MATGTPWLEKLKAARKTALVQDGKRKIHFTFEDETELVEEYDVKTQCLLTRKWKKKTTLGGDGKWDFEVGEPPTLFNPLDEITEANTNPRFSRSDTAKAFQWRIRNMPYPLGTYQIEVDSDTNSLILRTTNKKYYKRFDVPDMQRMNLPLKQDALSLSHANNTLLISYTKPDEILQYEKQLKQHLSSVKSLDEGQGDCKTS
ncbi:Protein dpcd [Clonorchis sinensis]|uniref:Protein DPCD n=1 Tax=Clonorchis sinensis TaxID=79923 RepID=A0A8T1MCR1_CLOSI|nr:Protein dpcd [Clonorchis sinensis]